MRHNSVFSRRSAAPWKLGISDGVAFVLWPKMHAMHGRLWVSHPKLYVNIEKNAARMYVFMY